MTVNIGFGTYKVRKKTIKTLIKDIEGITGHKVGIIRKFFMYLGRGIYYLFLPISYPWNFLLMFVNRHSATPEQIEKQKNDAWNTILLEEAIKKVFREDYPDDKSFHNAVVLKAIDIEREWAEESEKPYKPSSFGALMDLLTSVILIGKAVLPVSKR